MYVQYRNMFSVNEIPREGLVYRIHVGEYYYTGSTVGTLYKRIANHKQTYAGSGGDASERKVYKTISENGGWDSVKISILEKDIPEAKLRQKEQSYINKDDPFSLNSYNVIAPIVPARLPTRSDSRRKSDKKYYEAHKEELKKKRMERYKKDKEDQEKYAKLLKKHREAQARHAAKSPVE